MAFHGRLRPFQHEAVDMMLDRRRLLLAVVMGGGKTVIAIAALEELHEAGEVSAGLIIVPAAVKRQWVREIERFTRGEANVVLIDGPPKKRALQYEEFARRGEYAILNYEQVVNDWAAVSILPCDFIVCDEVQALKGFTSKRSQAMQELQMGVPYVFGLTGQPVENRPEEVFSIMEVVDDRVLGDYRLFDQTFIERDHSTGRPARYRNLPTLHQRLQQAMFRRSEEEIADQLPKVVGPVLEEARMDGASRRLYDYVVEDLLVDLDEAGAGARWSIEAHYGRGDSGNLEVRGRIMSKVMALRMLLAHPELLGESADKFVNTDGKHGSAYAWELQRKGMLDKIGKAPKMALLKKNIEEILDASAETNVVVFSFFKGVLRRLHKEYPHESVIYTGDESKAQRDRAHQAFLHQRDKRIFFASDAGGTGLDLPIATHVINYDLPWSFGLYAQRNARVRRLSSPHSHVTVVNMLMEDTLEIRQYDILQKKAEVADAVVDGKMSHRGGKIEMDVDTLREFLEDRRPIV